MARIARPSALTLMLLIGLCAIAPSSGAVPGARDQVRVAGSLPLDGALLDAKFLGAVVLWHGLVSPCQLDIPAVHGGRYEISVAASGEITGCGRRGREVALWTYVGGTKLFTTTSVSWPATSRRHMTFNAAFSSTSPAGAVPPTVELNGQVFDRQGRLMPGGTRVETFIDGTRCAVGSVRRRGDYDGYILAVVGPDSVAGCSRGATISFQIDGHPARATAVNTPGAQTTVDLTRSS